MQLSGVPDMYMLYEISESMICRLALFLEPRFDSVLRCLRPFSIESDSLWRNIRDRMNIVVHLSGDDLNILCKKRN